MNYWLPELCLFLHSAWISVYFDVLFVSDVASVHVAYYIMTSEGTHEETTSFWKAHQYFGLPAEDVFFFQQGMLQGRKQRQTSHFGTQKVVVKELVSTNYDRTIAIAQRGAQELLPPWESEATTGSSMNFVLS